LGSFSGRIPRAASPTQVEFTPTQLGANALATLAFQPWKVFMNGVAIARNKVWFGEVQLGRAFPPPRPGGKTMLVLTRRIGETIVISNDIEITVVSVRGDRVRLGITAPEFVQVDRKEVHQRRLEGKTGADRLEAVSAHR
jgi:carbon storage regulator